MGVQMKYQPRPEAMGRLDAAFKHHPPHGDQAARYEVIRQKAWELGNLMLHLCPESRELSLALTHLQQASQWANCAIAVNEKPPA